MDGILLRINLGERTERSQWPETRATTRPKSLSSAVTEMILRPVNYVKKTEENRTSVGLY